MKYILHDCREKFVSQGTIIMRADDVVEAPLDREGEVVEVSDLGLSCVRWDPGGPINVHLSAAGRVLRVPQMSSVREVLECRGSGECIDVGWNQTNRIEKRWETYRVVQSSEGDADGRGICQKMSCGHNDESQKPPGTPGNCSASIVDTRQ